METIKRLLIIGVLLAASGFVSRETLLVLINPIALAEILIVTFLASYLNLGWYRTIGGFVRAFTGFRMIRVGDADLELFSRRIALMPLLAAALCASTMIVEALVHLATADANTLGRLAAHFFAFLIQGSLLALILPSAYTGPTVEGIMKAFEGR